MRLVMFTKFLKEKSIEEIAELGYAWGLNGFDLCVRPEYAVTPENAMDALPEAVAKFAEKGLEVPMVTGPWDLLSPDEPNIANLVAAMDKANVRLLKIGYFKFDPETMDYQQRLVECRETLRSWAPLARKHNVRICYHTHSNKCMGLNAGGLAHLLECLDPSIYGAYLDAGHLRAEGEDFAVALGMVKPWLQMLAVKDVLLANERENDHGKIVNKWVPAGNGSVNWTYVFSCLKKINWQKPISIHCEFKCAPEDFLRLAGEEVAFFRKISE